MMRPLMGWVVLALTVTLVLPAASAAAPPVSVDHGLFGAFRANGTALEGSFVYFKVNTSTGHLVLYSVGATKKDVVFDDVNVTPFRSARPAALAQASYHLAATNVLITSHDTPRAPLSYKAGAEATQVTFRPASGIAVKLAADASIVNVTFGVNSGWIVMNGGNLTIVNGSVIANLPANGRVTFHMAPRASIWDTRVQDVEAAIARGDLGAEAVVVRQDAGLLSDVSSYGGLVSFDRLNSSVAEVTLRSSSSSGRSFVLHFDNSTLRPNASRFSVLVNGTAAAPTGVLGGLVPGSAPRFAVIESTRGLTVLLSLPAFVEKAVVISENAPSSTTPTPPPPATSTPPPTVSSPPTATPPQTSTPQATTPSQAKPTPGLGSFGTIAVAGLVALLMASGFDSRPRRLK